MEPKKGQPYTINIGSTSIVIRPLPLKKFRVAVDLVVKILAELGQLSQEQGDLFLQKLPGFILDYFDRLSPILLEGHDQAWIAENLTMPHMEEILRAAVVVNGIEDFFGQAKAGFVNPASPKAPTSALPGSSTSSASATAGPSEIPKS